jgi:hypothetical protein
MKMKITTLLCTLILAALIPLAAAEPPAPAPSPVASVTAADFAWMTGTWQGEVEGDFAEDQWSEPAGGVLMGMFRWVKGGKDGKLALYEFLSIEPGPDGPILWLRHFGARLVAREDKEGALAFHLTAYKPNEATFDNRDPKNPLRLIYRRESADRLVAVLERTENGKPVVTEFVYRRK